MGYGHRLAPITERIEGRFARYARSRAQLKLNTFGWYICFLKVHNFHGVYILKIELEHFWVVNMFPKSTQLSRGMYSEY